MIYEDTTKDEIKISVNEHVADTFIKCLLESGYMVGKRGDGANIMVKIRREE